MNQIVPKDPGMRRTFLPFVIRISDVFASGKDSRSLYKAVSSGSVYDVAHLLNLRKGTQLRIDFAGAPGI